MLLTAVRKERGRGSNAHLGLVRCVGKGCRKRWDAARLHGPVGYFRLSLSCSTAGLSLRRSSVVRLLGLTHALDIMQVWCQSRSTCDVSRSVRLKGRRQKDFRKFLEKRACLGLCLQTRILCNFYKWSAVRRCKNDKTTRTDAPSEVLVRPVPGLSRFTGQPISWAVAIAHSRTMFPRPSIRCGPGRGAVARMWSLGKGHCRQSSSRPA